MAKLIPVYGSSGKKIVAYVQPEEGRKRRRRRNLTERKIKPKAKSS